MDTLEKLNDEIEKLFNVEDVLSTLLGYAGRDTGTKYTAERLELYDDLRDLCEGLETFLEQHRNTITTLESALEPLPIKPQKTLLPTI